MNSKQQAMYGLGREEAINYGPIASFEDFCLYVGAPEEYEFYVDGWEDGKALDAFLAEE